MTAPRLGGFWLRFDGWASGAKGPLLAAALVLLTALPGMFALPPLDRDESRFAQATAQMLETNDFINIRYQSAPRDKKPVGIHWLQAASVKLLSSVERRDIWAYRLPSLLGAMTAAAACAWGASAFFGSRASLLAGAVLGCSFILSSEAFIAKTDAVLCGAITLAMAALGRLYGASKGCGQAGRAEKSAFWLGMAVSILDKGPIGPMVAALALVSLWIADRQILWAKSLGWVWGLTLVAVIVGPWAVAITVSTDGEFWTGALNGDLAPKLAGGQETHGAPPGLHTLLLPILLFPSTFLAPAAAVAGWRGREAPAVRFALAWLIPSWIVFELLPTKLPHYTLPTYGAVAWLVAAALSDPAGAAFGRWTRGIGATLSLAVGLLFCIAIGFLVYKYDGWSAAPFAIVTGAAALATGITGALALIKGRVQEAVLGCLAFGIVTHVGATGVLAPRLTALWTSQRAAQMVINSHLDPRNGVTTGPVAVVGYAEPSLVFALGTETELDDPQDGAESMADGQPVIVEKKQTQAFQAALAAQNVKGRAVGEIKGFDYSTGKRVDLTLWRSLTEPTGQAHP